MECTPVAGAGMAPSPVVRGAGALPFTGIEDILLPSLGGLLLLLGGIVAYRYASVRDSVDEEIANRPIPARRITGYEGAQDQMHTDPTSATFWGDEQSAVA